MTGRAPAGQATRASHGAELHRLHHTASVLRALVERIESASAGHDDLSDDIEAALGIDWSTDCTTSIDGALQLLPLGADWRRLTPTSTSAYAASPYNAAAQRRHDGYGKTVALQICSAALKVRLEPILKAIATEARRAGTGNTDPVHEGAGLKGIAQTEGNTGTTHKERDDG